MLRLYGRAEAKSRCGDSREKELEGHNFNRRDLHFY